MADFGLTVSVREGSDSGPVIPNARLSGTLIPATTDATGLGTIEGLLLTVEADGFLPYVAQPYHRPSLQAPVTVSLRRRSP